MDIMDIMDNMYIMYIMDILIITAWMAMAGAVSALVLSNISKWASLRIWINSSLSLLFKELVIWSLPSQNNPTCYQQVNVTVLSRKQYTLRVIGQQLPPFWSI